MQRIHTHAKPSMSARVSEASLSACSITPGYSEQIELVSKKTGAWVKKSASYHLSCMAYLCEERLDPSERGCHTYDKMEAVSVLLIGPDPQKQTGGPDGELLTMYGVLLPDDGREDVSVRVDDGGAGVVRRGLETEQAELLRDRIGCRGRGRGWREGT